jgi:hypothetical protein
MTSSAKQYKSSHSGMREVQTSDVQWHIGESRDFPMRNCASEVWSFGPSRNDGVLTLQLLFLSGSESMGNHDSIIVDAGSVD